MCSGSSLDRCTWVCSRTNTRPSSSSSLGQAGLWPARPGRGNRGARIQFDRVHVGVISTSRLPPLVAQLLLDIPTSPTDPLGEVMIFGVSWGAPTDLGDWGGLSGQFEEVIIFRDKQTLYHNIFIIPLVWYHLCFQVWCLNWFWLACSTFWKLSCGVAMCFPKYPATCKWLSRYIGSKVCKGKGRTLNRCASVPLIPTHSLWFREQETEGCSPLPDFC